MRSVAVITDGSPNDAQSLEAAMAVCDYLGARLTVVHTRLRDQIVVDAGPMPAVIDNEAAASSIAQAARESFDTVCGGKPNCRWQETTAAPAEAIVEVGRFHDLLILERLSELEGPEALALNAALIDHRGPVLVTPPEMPASLSGTVALAWTMTPQAGRALHAGMAFMQKAEKVVILSLEAGENDVAEVTAYLADYGVTAEWRDYETGGMTARGRGRALLKAAEQAGAQLLISGAFAAGTLESILRLGRATTKIASAAKIPVLFQS